MPEQEVSLKFPFQGIDNSKGYTRQPPETTQDGVNVRAYDAGTDRRRGGSRAGLTPFLGAGSTVQVSGFNRIQSLSSIVTASQNATFAKVLVTAHSTMDYAETDSPPIRVAPEIILADDWFEGTSPTFTLVSGVVVGSPDGGGTGQGTASFRLSTDGTTVTIVGTFLSAGFPPAPDPDYFYSGPAKVVTHTIPQASFFPPGTGFVAFTWTVVNFTTGFIATLDVVLRTA